MADTKNKPGKAAAPKKNGKSFLSLFAALLLAMLAVFLLPTTIMIVIGMVPTIVAFFVDTSREKNLGPTVFCLNFAGVFPALLKLWKSSHTVDNAIDLMIQPSVMLVILMASGFGWLLYLYIPPLVSTVMRKRGEARIRQLEKQQEELVEQWSMTIVKTTDGVKSDKPDSPAAITSSVSA